MSIFRSALDVLKAVGRFLDSPEVPTKKSERINDIMLGIILVLVLVAVFIGNMLLVTGPAAFPVG
jgi:uncharacterized membrane protein